MYAFDVLKYLIGDGEINVFDLFAVQALWLEAEKGFGPATESDR